MTSASLPPALLESQLPGVPVRRGKVRDVYDLGDKLLLVATDRISAFDWVMPTGIPDKGRILTQLSTFWFELLGVPNHLISTDIDSIDLPPGCDREASSPAAATIVKKCRVVPVECVVRGYLEGSGWKEYREGAAVCGIAAARGAGAMLEAARADFHARDEGRKRPRSEHFVRADDADCGPDDGREAAASGASIFTARAADHARKRGIIIADTKFECGWTGQDQADDELILIDEVLTPDSSRFWPADKYQPGRCPALVRQAVFCGNGWRRRPGTKTAHRPPLPERDCRRHARQICRSLSSV